MLRLFHFFLFSFVCTFPLYGFQLPRNFNELPLEERALVRDLKLINFPPFDWRGHRHQDDLNSTYDVVIIGGGMSGLTAGTALFKEGIFHLKVFDKNPAGEEGPWITYARMKTLRSYKGIMGPALGIPSLTFHAWFEALYGAGAWKQLNKIPNALWMDYLKWYRKAMQLPIENEATLVDLIPNGKGFMLHFLQRGQPLIVQARKVILATGRNGFGGAFIPSFAKDLPQSACAHTMDPIDFRKLKDRDIAIIGVGASSFDAAATALEGGAKKVDLFMRRQKLPTVNKFSRLPYHGFNHGYYKADDGRKWELMSEAFLAPIPPPLDSVKRVEGYSNLTLYGGTSIEKIDFDGSKVKLTTNRGVFVYDFLILGTGYNVDGTKQPELRHVITEIALWKDRLPSDIIDQHPKLGEFPYLGPCYEFLPKDPVNNLAISYLKNLYCYNYAAIMSHGLLSSEIPAISIGATRLAQGIAADFFIEESEYYLNLLKNDNEEDFSDGDYTLNIQ